jgi:DNA-binding SARP family transcriptional activator/tetratricopeptide (TPR) repeat protein
LGAPLLLTATGEAVRYRTRKHFALLIRLALEPGKKLARDYLIELLWPDASLQHGRHSLSQAITVLRSTIGRQFLAAHRATLALAEGAVEVDARGLDSCEAEVRGRFLDGFEVRGARGFEEWREGWAARLYPRIRDCLVKQMDAGRRIGDFATVEKHALVLEELDPLAEDAVRGIMEARAWVGDRSNALKAFNRFAIRLAEELNAKPSPELVRIADLLREGRRAAPRPTEDGVPRREERRFEAETIIGRETEFSALYDAWLAVRHRQPRVMVLLGDPGIGKTTLTNAFVSSCQMEGGVIARAQAYDAERELPYAVLAELVRQLTQQRAIGAAEPEALAELSRLTPEIFKAFPGVEKPSEWPPEVVPLRLADSFLKAVTAAAEENPVVLVVDDIHAADNASVAIVHLLARKLEGLRLLLILTARSGDIRSTTAARALVTDSGIEALRTIEVDTLSAEAATILVARVGAKGIERWGEAPIAKIVRSGAGNPLALELLTREWVAHGGDSLIGQLESLNTVPASSLSLPQAIRAVVERQTQQLDEKTRAVLDLAAVLGRRMGDLWLYEVIGCPEAETLMRLGQLLESRLLREVAGQIEFRNELVRAHAYYEISSTIRLELHRRVAQVLERQAEEKGHRDLEIAWHYLIGRDPGRAVPYALTGAEESLRAGAPHEAELILRSLVREDFDNSTLLRVKLVLSSALMGQSKAEEAVPLLDELLADEQAPKPQIAQAVRLYAYAMYLLNRNSTAKHSEMAERALRIARECDDKELLARALFECGRAGVESGNEELTRRAREELRQMLASGDADIPPIAFHADAYCSYYLLDIEEASESAEQAVGNLSRAGSIGELALAYTGLGNCRLALCRLEEARDAYRSALGHSKRMGDDSRISIICSNIGATYLISGETDKAIACGEESLLVAKYAPAQPVLMKTFSNLTFAYILAGQTKRAMECVESWQSWIQDGRSWASNVECCCELAEVELAFGNTTEALKLIVQAERGFDGVEFPFVTQGVLERLMVFLKYHTEGPETARILAESSMRRFKDRHLIAYLEALAAFAWIERKASETHSAATSRELILFEKYGAQGKRAILVAQGFLC